MAESLRKSTSRMAKIAGGPILSQKTMGERVESENVQLPLWLSHLFIYAGREIPSPSHSATLLVIQAVFMAISIWGTGALGVLIAFLPALIGLAALHRMGRHRAQRFEQDYTAFLLSLSSSIRTGLDPLLAFYRCSGLFHESSVVRGEIQRTVAEIHAGIEEESAFRRFASSVKHPDVSLLRTALILSHRQGSSLSACLQRLAKVTRQRQSFRRKMRGAIAMQRLSAFGIAGCTVIVGVIQYTANPHSIQQAWNHPSGGIALVGGIVLVAFGLLWMVFMSRGRL